MKRRKYQYEHLDAARHTIIPAVHVFFIRNGCILLTKRCHTGYMDGKYNLPGGHLNVGEVARKGAAREAKEEVGITVRPETLTIAHIMHKITHGEHDRVDFYFIAPRWEGKARNCEPQKCDDVDWFPLNKLPDMLTPHRFALEQYLAGVFYSEYSFKTPC